VRWSLVRQPGTVSGGNQLPIIQRQHHQARPHCYSRSSEDWICRRFVYTPTGRCLPKHLSLRNHAPLEPRPMPRPIGGHFGIARSVRLSVPWRSCLGYRHTGCLQLSHRRPPETCGLCARLRTDVDPPRFLLPSNCYRWGHIVSPAPGIPC